MAINKKLSLFTAKSNERKPHIITFSNIFNTIDKLEKMLNEIVRCVKSQITKYSRSVGKSIMVITALLSKKLHKQVQIHGFEAC